MPRIQQSGNSYTVNIPKDVRELLGWKKSDLLMIDVDKIEDSITLKRIKED